MVSVILPTYNEADNIRVIVPRIYNVLLNSNLEGEIIIVDDNSPDGTAEAARVISRDYPLSIHVRKEEKGLATAILKGFELASGDICVVMDADLSHPVEKIPEMVKPIEEGACEATVGSRYTSGGDCKNWPFMRRFISKFSGFLARGLTKLSDPTSGFMAIRKDALNGVQLDPVGWKIVLEVIVRTGVRLREVPIAFADRQKGESKLDKRVKAQYIAHLLKLYHFKYPAIFQFLRFCAVGFLGLIMDTAILVALVEVVRIDPRFAAVFAFVATVSFNYVLNRTWTFTAARAVTRVATSYAWFIAVCSTGLLVRLSVMHLLIKFCNMGVGFRYVLASLIGIFMATLFNFLGSKFVAFSYKFNVRA
jgi:dolichol-phosphate mannosyltransferase